MTNQFWWWHHRFRYHLNTELEELKSYWISSRPGSILFSKWKIQLKNMEVVRQPNQWNVGDNRYELAGTYENDMILHLRRKYKLWEVGYCLLVLVLMKLHERKPQKNCQNYLIIGFLETLAMSFILKHPKKSRSNEWVVLITGHWINYHNFTILLVEWIWTNTRNIKFIFVVPCQL